MHIRLDEQFGTITIWAATEEEAEQIRSVAEAVEPETELPYIGVARGTGGEAAPPLQFGYGGQRWRVIKNEGDSDDPHYTGQIFEITGTSLQDQHAIGFIRNLGRRGAGKLIFLRVGKVGNRQSLVFTGRRCKQCRQISIDQDMDLAASLTDLCRSCIPRSS